MYKICESPMKIKRFNSYYVTSYNAEQMCFNVQTQLHLLNTINTLLMRVQISDGNMHLFKPEHYST